MANLRAAFFSLKRNPSQRCSLLREQRNQTKISWARDQSLLTTAQPGNCRVPVGQSQLALGRERQSCLLTETPCWLFSHSGAVLPRPQEARALLSSPALPGWRASNLLTATAQILSSSSTQMQNWSHHSCAPNTRQCLLGNLQPLSPFGQNLGMDSATAKSCKPPWLFQQAL